MSNLPPPSTVILNTPSKPIEVDRIVADILSARASVYAASAWFTNMEIADAIIASEAKIKVVVVGATGGDSGAIKKLQRNGVAVYIIEDFHMKVLVCDAIIWIGSYNLTYQAASNYEAVVRFTHSLNLSLFMIESIEDIIK